jgi:hypothetical protein
MCAMNNRSVAFDLDACNGRSRHIVLRRCDMWHSDNAPEPESFIRSDPSIVVFRHAGSSARFCIDAGRSAGAKPWLVSR